MSYRGIQYGIGCFTDLFAAGVIISFGLLSETQSIAIHLPYLV